MSNQSNNLLNSPLYRVGRWMFSWHTRIVFATYLKINVKRIAELPTGSFIICSNHESHLDAIILGYVGSSDFNRTAFIAAKDYWYDNKWRYNLSNLFFNLIPIARKVNNSVSIRQTIEMVNQFCKSGTCSIAILPEGTRSTNRKMKSFKPGVLALAKECQLPIVPVYIDHSSRFWPKGKYFIKPGRLQVIVGKPILPGQLSDVGELKEEIVKLSQTCNE